VERHTIVIGISAHCQYLRHHAGALVVAGDEDAAAVGQVVNRVPAGDETIVQLRPLPGVVDDYRPLVDRAFAS
jgi:hypothetical protein